MASPRPRLKLGFFKLPPNAAYVTRGRSVMGEAVVLTNASGNTSPSYAWTQLPYQFLDDIFTFREVPLIGGQVTDFSANLRLNVGCDWQFSWQYDVNNPNHVAVVEAAADPAAFCAWYIQTDDAADDVASLSGFMGGGVLEDITSETSPILPTVFVPDDHYSRRGMSGPVATARASELADGTGLLEVAGTCWAQALNDTADVPAVPNVIPTVQKTAYSPTDIPTTRTRRQVQIRAWMAHIFRDSSDLKATPQWVSDAPTQIGRWLLRPAFTQAALDRMSELTDADGSRVNFRYETGPHSVLKTLQNLVARAGLVMHTTFPIIWFDAGVSTVADAVLRPVDYASSTLTRRKPAANYFIATHSDPVTRAEAPLGVDGGTITVIRADTDSIALYGLITQTLTSTVPQRVLPEAGEDPAVSNDEVRELLEAQISDAAIRAFATEDGDIETRWLAGSRYGIDWNVGDTVRVYVGGLVSDLLLVNSAAIRMNSAGDWSFRAGLGSTADLAPQIRHRIELGETVSF